VTHVHALADIVVDGRESARSVPLYVVSSQSGVEACLAGFATDALAWAGACQFRFEPGARLVLRDTLGNERLVVGCVDPANVLWSTAALAARLAPLDYRLAGGPADVNFDLLVLGWWHGLYRLDRFRTAGRDRDARPRLIVNPGTNLDRAGALADATELALDLVNSPPNQMGPAELQTAFEQVAHRHGAQVRAVIGDALLTDNYPLIHAVGRASRRLPRLLELRWGRTDAPRLAIVGKGVCFDAGGLNLKGREDMLLMKKDMAGAAQALALGALVMQRRLDVRLRVLIPAVENFISDQSFRPLDVYRSRKGISVEIGDTDAEGRLTLADALTDACADTPEMVIDFATLTGSTTKAFGPEIAGFMTNDDALGASLMQASSRWQDPVWRLPLHTPYRELLKSQVGDIASIVRYTGAGAILAGLFLAEFVPAGVSWLHVDFFGWNVSKRPGRAVGAETHGLRAVFGLLEQRYSKSA
jgi:leucyl aminopeptidase